ncbi:MAG TPA: hypothetical protein VJI97_00010 [Candidatus Nanoarchaeia archaeon]|nr:hypothetical protein [Candidatus Nanoarchaeia archaeon]
MGEASIQLEKIIVVDPRKKGGLFLKERLYMTFGTNKLSMGPQFKGFEQGLNTTFYPTRQEDAGKYCVVVEFGGEEPVATFVRYAHGNTEPIFTEMNELEIKIDEEARAAIDKHVPRIIVAYFPGAQDTPAKQQQSSGNKRLM